MLFLPAVGNSLSRQAPTGAVLPVRIYTDPSYIGEAGSELVEIGNEINRYVSAHPDTFSGGYFSGDSSEFHVGIARADDAAVPALEELADRLDPGRRLVKTSLVARSWSQLDAVKNSIVRDYLSTNEGGVTSVGLDISAGAAVVGILRKPGDVSVMENTTALAITARYGDAVMFREVPGPTSGHSASDDLSPH